MLLIIGNHCNWHYIPISAQVPPPPMETDHAYYKTIQEDPRYADVPKAELPTCESLELTINRTLPCVISQLLHLSSDLMLLIMMN